MQMSPSSSVMTITPQMAEQWLGHNTKNRTLRDPQIRSIAADMKNNRWKLNGETIIFSDTGVLLNGQHRLKACIEANTPFTSVVIQGIENDAFSTIDSGAKRTASDVLSMEGIKYSAITAAAARIIMFYVEKKYERLETMSNANTIEFVRNNPRLVQAANLVGSRSSLHIYGSHSVLSALVYFGLEIDVPGMKRFLAGLEVGDNLPQGSPILATRNFFINAKARRVAMSQRHRFALLIKGWNAFYEGRNMKVLKFGRDEEFPLISGQRRLL